jgi:hypothetical protein
MTNSELLLEIIKTLTGMFITIKSLNCMNCDNVNITSLGIFIGVLFILM